MLRSGVQARSDQLPHPVRGSKGIPADVTAAVGVHGAAVLNGAITMTWQDDDTALDGITYVLTADGLAAPVQWAQTGSCTTNALC